MIIRGIFTNTKLSPTRMNSETTVPYIVANECPGLKRGGLFNNAGKGFNPMMLMALADNNSSDFMTMMMMSQLMGGGNMFGNMFGAANKSTTETPEPSELDKINAKVDTLTDNVNALVSALASNIKSQTKEEA